ncbi:hypothetical protein [Cellulophaga tyrosinoxydans]|uniref:Lipocalin-like domain-containing protein n=1 Tax=Cellulophaga tyrosinoxydans TaxID=504486 RepID=A0A1W2CH57_9FLAO|nr:hypothetical protein [Cellulophaga tyrosinoxydans]SMC84501.1 hypothetical protein SAMN05660703_2995 [Cellulophaga tyrosinoxydans]
MKKSILVIFTIILTACNSKVTEEQLSFLNGYWEIEKVILPDGQKKEYKVNETIDFIEVKDLKGFRKKVNPTFEGTYITSDDAELFTIIQRDDEFLMQYKTDISEWTETLKTVTKDNFSVTGEDNFTYFYKRYVPINLNE